MPFHPAIPKVVSGTETSPGKQPIGEEALFKRTETAGGRPPKPVGPPQAGSRSSVIPSARCSVRGCIFPATGGNPPRCAYHQREVNEPQMFETHQPSHLFLGKANYGLPDTEPDDSRLRARWQREKRRTVEDAG